MFTRILFGWLITPLSYPGWDIKRLNGLLTIFRIFPQIQEYNILNLNRHSKYVDDLKNFISELKMTFLREVLGAKCESSFPDLENTVWKVGI